MHIFAFADNVLLLNILHKTFCKQMLYLTAAKNQHIYCGQQWKTNIKSIHKP